MDATKTFTEERYFTLWEILNSIDFGEALTFTRQLGTMAETGENPDDMIAEDYRSFLISFLGAAEIRFATLGLKTSVHAIHDFIRILKSRPFVVRDVQTWAQQTFKAVQYETTGMLCLRVSMTKEELISGNGGLAQYVLDRFPMAYSEVMEAANCLCFERGTATVFHLMRACEVVLKSLFKSGGWAPPKMAESWGAMLAPIDGQLVKPPANPVAVWQSNIAWFSEVVHDLRAAKRSYRDSTMHVESVYTLEDARAVFGSVITLLRHAANHLDQDGNFLSLP